MKKFSEIEVDNTEVVIQQPKVDLQKTNLLKNVGDFSIRVLTAIEKWLFSFPTGMTKEAFQRQIDHIDKDEEVALRQLKEAYGYRVIRAVKEEHPKMEKSYIDCIADDTLFLAIEGKKKDCEKYVLQAIHDLREYGSVYVLDCAVLFSDLKSARERGSSDTMLEEAEKCDFLIIESLAQDIGYVSNVACWSLVALVNSRYERRKPILTRYNDYKNLAAIYEKCPLYSV